MLLLLLLFVIGAFVVMALALRRRRRNALKRVVARWERRAEDDRRARPFGRPRIVPSAETTDGRVEELEIGGQRRSYLFYRPTGVGIGAPPPLVMAFHGGFGNPIGFARRTGLNDAADRHGFAVVYPAAHRHWADGRETTGLGLEDVEFAVQLCDRMKRVEGIDGQRIYALGASNGGMFVFRLTTEIPQLFAAFSTNMASLPVGMAEAVELGPPVPLIMVNGVCDALTPWYGGVAGRDLGVGGTIIGVEDTLARWVRRNRCGPSQMTPWWSEAMDSVVAAELYDYPAAADGARLRFLKLLQWGHDWPREPLIQPGVPDGAMVETLVADIIWEFLSLHVLGSAAARSRIEVRQPGDLERH